MNLIAQGHALGLGWRLLFDLAEAVCADGLISPVLARTVAFVMEIDMLVAIAERFSLS